MSPKHYLVFLALGAAALFQEEISNRHKQWRAPSSTADRGRETDAGVFSHFSGGGDSAPVEIAFARSKNQPFRYQTHTKPVRQDQDTQNIRLNIPLLDHSIVRRERIEFPLFGRRLNIVKKRAVERSDDDFTWHGAVDDDATSSVVFTVVDGHLFGVIQLDGRSYQVKNNEDGTYRVIRLSGMPVKPGDDVIVHQATAKASATRSDSGGSFGTNASMSSATGGPVIDVLVLYTEALAAREGSGLNAYLQNKIDIANAAYADSGVVGNMRLLKTERIDPSLESVLSEDVAIDNALNALVSDSSVQSRRDAAGADLVALARAYRGQNSCGLAFFSYSTDRNGNKTLLSDSAFSVIETGRWYYSPNTYYYCSDTTFAHETGHNLGGQHDRDHTQLEGFFSYSHGHDVPGEFATIMSYDSPEINFFSTPTISYNGMPIGVAEGKIDSADNVRTFNQTLSKASEFRTAPPMIDNDDDGIDDSRDNCPTVYNPAQTDVDNDGIGDACDTGDYDGDGLSDRDEVSAGTDPANPDSDGDGAPDGLDSDSLDSRYQGSAQGSASVDQTWSTIALPSLFTDPVVIVGPPSFHGRDPGVVRIKNVTANGFEATYQLRFQEWDYKDGAHASETIPHVVLETGRHSMPDGSIWEAGRYDQSGTGSPKTIFFSQAFAAPPELFLTVQTSNGGQAVTVRAKNVTAEGFDSALYEQQSLMDGHAAETVGYLAVFSPAGGGLANIGGRNRPYFLSREQVDERWHAVLSTALKVEEEQSLDNETGHVDETLSILGLGQQVFAQDISSNGGDPIALRQKPQEFPAPVEWGTANGITDRWRTIPLRRRYNDPVVVVKQGIPVGADLGVIRLRNVTAESFQVRFQEWDYLDGFHPAPERIHYLVAEQGVANMGGLSLQAGKLTTGNVYDTGQPENVVFADDFGAKLSGPPALLTGIMTSAGGDAVIARVGAVDTAGFTVSLQEQESKQDGHVGETIGWIAIGTGTGRTRDGRRLESLLIHTDHLGLNRLLTFILDRRQAVALGSLGSDVGPDPAVARQTRLGSDEVGYRVQEERSRDTETRHARESISVFVAE